MTESRLAAWYRYHGQVEYTTFDSEDDAARWVAFADLEGRIDPLGVQFDDGRTVPAKSWPALAAARRRLREKMDRERLERAARPQIPMRTVYDPFGGSALTIPADEPSWLGEEAATGFVAERADLSGPWEVRR